MPLKPQNFSTLVKQFGEEGLCTVSDSKREDGQWKGLGQKIKGIRLRSLLHNLSQLSTRQNKDQAAVT